MATGSGVNQGKTEFLEEFLPGNRDADLDAAKRAWNAAGHEGTISESLFGKIRSKLKLTGKRGANGRSSKGAARPRRRRARPSRRERRASGRLGSGECPSSSAATTGRGSPRRRWQGGSAGSG